MAAGHSCRLLRRLSGFLLLVLFFCGFKQNFTESASTQFCWGTRLSATPSVEGGRCVNVSVAACTFISLQIFLLKLLRSWGNECERYYDVRRGVGEGGGGRRHSLWGFVKLSKMNSLCNNETFSRRSFIPRTNFDMSIVC